VSALTGMRWCFIRHLPPAEPSNVPASGSRFKRRRGAHDHRHRTEKDHGRPYVFKDAETLIDDSFDAVERVLRERGVGLRVTGEEETERSK
jgi:hypothetical protein